jgi:hypothetical protein
MKTSWQSESGGLICRWSDLLQSDQSTSPVIRGGDRSLRELGAADAGFRRT